MVDIILDIGPIVLILFVIIAYVAVMLPRIH